MNRKLGLCQFDHINLMITLSVITLSGAYSTASCKKLQKKFHFEKLWKNPKVRTKEVELGWDIMVF